jgi:hypothetical protein
MGQAKARGTKEQRLAEALSQPPKVRPMSKREAREFIQATVMKHVGQVFSKLR